MSERKSFRQLRHHAILVGATRDNQESKKMLHQTENQGSRFLDALAAINRLDRKVTTFLVKAVRKGNQLIDAAGL